MTNTKQIREFKSADGKLLSFVSPSHLYSLFGNAMDNAVEKVDFNKRDRTLSPP